MKIVLVCKVYPTARPGGMGFVCQDRARELVKLGHEVHVLTTAQTSKTVGSEVNDQNVNVHHIAAPTCTYTQFFANLLVEWVNHINPSVIHLDSFDNKRPWWRDFKGKVRLGLTMHGFCWGGYFTKLNIHMRQGQSWKQAPESDAVLAMYERSYMLDFDRVIGISLHEQWMLRQLMGLYDAKLLYNPIPDYFYQNIKPVPKGDRTFACVAISGQSERGFKYASQAAERAGVTLATPDRLNRTDIPSLLDRCCALVLPTAYAQGLDLAVGEAIARRRPVIVTATGSYLREAEHGGAYIGALRLVPLINPVPHLVQAMQGDLTVPWMPGYDIVHNVTNHTKAWLETMQ